MAYMNGECHRLGWSGFALWELGVYSSEGSGNGASAFRRPRIGGSRWCSKETGVNFIAVYLELVNSLPQRFVTNLRVPINHARCYRLLSIPFPDARADHAHLPANVT
jgi:hypothetical protein